MVLMVTMVAPLSVPRVNDTERDALARLDDTPRRLMVSVRDAIEAKHGAKPRDPLLRLLLRLGDQ
jgi:hypothetical protein